MEKSFQSYDLILTPAEGYFESKKSRFLALVTPIATEPQAQEILAQRRKTYYDARHHCYAYVLGERHQILRFSDDGEPSGTGGAPLREALVASGLHNCLLVVTRYFGGTLLGAGPLARAYSSAAADALAKVERSALLEGRRWQLVLPYTDLARVDRILAEGAIPVESEEYGTDVSRQIILTSDREADFLEALSDASSGRALAEPGEIIHFILQKGKAIPWDAPSFDAKNPD